MSASTGALISSATTAAFPNLVSAEGPSTFIQNGMHGLNGERVDARPTGIEAFERLASGGRREDVAKPKSLKAAEHAKQQEERKQRERQGREQERERERAKAASAATVMGKDVAMGVATSSSSGIALPAPAESSKKEHHSSVLCSADGVPPASSQEAPEDCSKDPLSSSTGSTGILAESKGTAQKALPPVPVFKTEPAMLLRQIDLKPKLDEDNYEISEHDGDSEEEGGENRDRSGKHVPRWCETYLQDLNEQADIDPDTIFAAKVPRCDLEVVFTDEMYRLANKSRPKRMRGSSGDWRKDRLTCNEIKSYKSRMGHLRSWDEKVESAETPAVSG